MNSMTGASCDETLVSRMSAAGLEFRDARQQPHVFGDVVEDSEAEDDVGWLRAIEVLENVAEDEVVLGAGDSVGVHVVAGLHHESVSVLDTHDPVSPGVERGETEPSVVGRQVKDGRTAE